MKTITIILITTLAGALAACSNDDMFIRECHLHGGIYHATDAYGSDAYCDMNR